MIVDVAVVGKHLWNTQQMLAAFKMFSTLVILSATDTLTQQQVRLYSPLQLRIISSFKRQVNWWFWICLNPYVQTGTSFTAQIFHFIKYRNTHFMLCPNSILHTNCIKFIGYYFYQSNRNFRNPLPIKLSKHFGLTMALFCSNVLMSQIVPNPNNTTY